MDEKRIALVVPTIRENCFRDFVARWGELGLFQHVDLFLIEDNPKITFDSYGILKDKKDPDRYLIHTDWSCIEADLKEKSWIIPRRSDTVRSYGYWLTSVQPRKFDYVLTLDDDCYPPTEEKDGFSYRDARQFLDMHVQYLSKRTRWFNTLNKVKPRGIPYYNLGNDGSVVVNHGLWTNVLDYDAPTQLANPGKEEFSFDNRIVPAGSYFPMCGMNVMWRADVTVLMYHLLMGQVMEPAGEKQKGHPFPAELVKLSFDRFGDIWCGIIMKKICDELGYRVSTGMPYIRHERASNPFTNLKKEAPGMEVNERLWDYVDRCTMLEKTECNTGAYDLMGRHIEKYDEFPEHRNYFMNLGKAMQVWAGLFV